MLKEEKQIGLDRMCLTVNYDDLVIEGDDLSVIDVKDGAIVLRPNAFHKDLVDIMVNAPKLFYATNERNVTTDKMFNLIEVIQEQLEEHGILADIGNIKLGSFEVNYNIDDSKFYDVFALIGKANINDNLKAFYVEDKNGIQSVKIKKQRYTVKIYKKSEHLQERFEPTEEDTVVRFEVSTNSDKEKQKIMGDDLTLRGLIENWERVEDWYRNCIKLTVKKPIEKYVADMEKQCIEKLEAGLRPTDVITWLMLRQDLVDVVVFEGAIKKHYKKHKKSSPTSVIKSAHKRLQNTNEKRYKETTGNVQKMHEFYELIGLEK